MRITVLTENTEGSRGCGYEHGLSLYIETDKHRLLMDTGVSDLLIRNAERLGIDLAAVDTVILSHGHYDHSGGIFPFLEMNRHAVIYMRRTAVLDYYHGERYIGIDKDILKYENIIFTDESLLIDSELELFSGIRGRRYFSRGNLALTRLEKGTHLPDSFDHEQCLVISCGGSRILISGCAHNGILNILDKYEELYKSSPDIVISGFHLRKKENFTVEEKEAIESTARELMKYPAVFYTGHCTGIPAYRIMKVIMGDKLRGIHSGDDII